MINQKLIDAIALFDKDIFANSPNQLRLIIDAAREKEAMKRVLDGAKVLLQINVETIEQLRKERDELALGLILSDGCFTDDDCDILDKARKLAKEVLDGKI